MIRNKPAICIDIDNVIAKTDETMRTVIRLNSQLRVNLDYDDVVCFDYWMCRDKYGNRFTHEEWQKIHDEFTDNYLDKINPFEDVQKYLNILKRKYTLHIATSRLIRGKKSTLTWLLLNKIPYEELHFVKEGAKHLIDRPFVAAIEDDREQGYAFNSKGVEVFLLKHPWNNIGPYSPLRILSTWSEITGDLINMV